MGLGNWLQKQQAKESDAVRNRHGYRSSFYHKEFAGYSERKYIDENGKSKIERKYAADYFEPRLTKRQQITRRIIYSVLYVFSVLFYGYAGLQDTQSNYAIYVVIPVAAALALLFIMFTALINYFPLGKIELPRMNKGAKRLRRSSLWCAISLMAASAATVVHIIVNRSQTDSISMICAVMFFAGGAMILTIYIIEQRIIYDVVKNETEIEDSIIIR